MNAQTTRTTAMTAKSSAKAVSYKSGENTVELSVSTVKNYLVSGDASKVSDRECVMFINLCKYNGLNPWLKEAYLVKFGSSPATMVPGKEAFMKRAERNPSFDGKEAGITVLTQDGQVDKRNGCAYYPDLGETLLGGWAKIWRKDQSHPTYSEVSLSEYNKKQNKWVDAPATMIRKVALVQALREAFPCDLGGMYSAEEQGVREPDYVIEDVPAAAPVEAVTENESDDPFEVQA